MISIVLKHNIEGEWAPDGTTFTITPPNGSVDYYTHDGCWLHRKTPEPSYHIDDDATSYYNGESVTYLIADGENRYIVVIE